MGLIISHESALEIYRSQFAHIILPSFWDAHAKRPKRVFTNNVSAPSKNDLQTFASCFPDVPKPLHVLVGMTNQRLKQNALRTHVDTRNPPLFLIDGALFDSKTTKCYVPIPELLFLQMAQTLPFVELVALGFELCGMYSISSACANSSERKKRVRPFTCAESIRSFIDATAGKGIRGVTQARKAAQFVLDGSASPRETELAILLSFPYRYGGYAFPPPILNRKIDIPKNKAQHFTSSYFKCDLFWEHAKLAVEYDSDSLHVGASKIAADSIRRNSLNLLGIEVATVTNRQITNMIEMDRIALSLSKKLGIRYRTDHRFDYTNRKLKLRQELAACRRFKL